MKAYLKIVLTLVFGCVLLSAQAQDEIQQQLDRIISEANVPGVQIVHIKNDKRETFCSGEMKYGSGEKVTPSTLFQACSMSKAVLSYIALVLADRGVIDLDKPLMDYWNYPRLSDEPQAKWITARIVLINTTGLPNWSKPRGAKLKVAFKPGTQFKYSGEGFYFLQQVLEHLTHKSLETLAREIVFNPLGMKQSHFVFEDEMKNDYATGHEGLKPLSPRKMEKPNGAYSLITTANDYSTFVQKALLKGEGLKKETHEMMIDYSSSRGPRTGYGMGVQMQRNEKGKEIFHNGKNPGFICFFFAYPDSGESLVMMTNGTQGVKIKKEIAKLFLGDQLFFAF